MENSRSGTGIDAERHTVGQRLHSSRIGRGWALEAIADKAGVSVSTLRLIERDRANPTMILLHRIAFSLGLPLAALTETNPAGRTTIVLRGDDPQYLYRDEPLIRTRALSPIEVENDVEVYELTLQPGARMNEVPTDDNEWVVAIVEQGRLGVGHEASGAVIERSDAASYATRGSSAWTNAGLDPAVAVVFEVHGVLGRHGVDAGGGFVPLADSAAWDASYLQSILAARVQAGRARRGWTLATVAARSGVSRSMLSAIERGESNPTLAVMRRISSALGISLQDLVSDPAIGDAVAIVHADRQGEVATEAPGVRRRLISPPHLAYAIEVEAVTLEPGAFVGGSREPRTWQILCVREGQVKMQCGEREVGLAPGDSAYAPADEPIRITNVAPGAAIFYSATIHKAAAPD